VANGERFIRAEASLGTLPNLVPWRLAPSRIADQSAKMDDLWQQLRQKHGKRNLYIEDEELESFATKKELQLNGKGEPVFSPCHFKLLPKRILEDYPIHETIMRHRKRALQEYADYDQMHVEYTGGSVPSFFYNHKDHAMQITHYLKNQILKFRERSRDRTTGSISSN
jgi:hypothetical protein